MVSAVRRRVSAGALVVGGLCLGLAVSAGLVRLLPWLVAPSVPLEVAGPFARALLESGLEAAFLIGLPAGTALGMARMTGLGETRALMALGYSPGQLLRELLPIGLGFVAIFVGAQSLLDSGGNRPGQFARQLISEAKQGCADTKTPHSFWVPVVDVTWLCFGDTPRVTGAFPGAGGKVWFTATELVPSDDLRTIELENLSLVARTESKKTRLRLRTKNARIAGLPSWGRGQQLRAWQRSLCVGTAALTTTLAVAWLLYRRRKPCGRVLALGLGLASPLLVLTLLKSMTTWGAPFWAFSALPALGVLAAGISERTAWALGSLAQRCSKIRAVIGR